MKILVLGSNGQLGRCLNDQLSNTHHDIVHTTRAEIDVSNFEKTFDAISLIAPNIIINATAYTAVDKAQEEHKIANLVNHLAVANIAGICHKLDILLIHFSTDYVFDGNSSLPYKENDHTNPQGVYGETKLKGELSIKSSNCKHIIIRTAWVFSEYENNFLKTIIRLASNKDELNIVGDQIGCPTYAQDIAKSIVKIIPQIQKKEIYDTYHYCGYRECSWYDFAIEIFKQANNYNIKTPSKINLTQTSSFPTQAKRPAFSSLDCTKIKKDFGVTASNWEKAIANVITKL